MSSDLSKNPSGDKAAPDPDGQADVSDLVQDLLDDILGAVNGQGQAGDGSPSAATAAVAETLSGPAGHAILQSVAASGMHLQELVTRIRGHFQQLADLEIRRILELAIGGKLASPAAAAATQPVQAPAPAGAVSEPPAKPAKAANQAPVDATAPDGDDRYEGTVRVRVLAEGDMQRVVAFVDELCQKPQFRMLRMSGSPQQEGAEIALGLRECIAFRKVVREMNNVDKVEGQDDLIEGAPATERLVTVHLTSPDNA